EAEEKRARRFGRAGRLLSLTGIVVVGVGLVLLVAAYAWWQSFKTSPPYSVALLLDAAQRDDMPGVESLIDADQIAQGFVPQVFENLAGAGSALPPQARASLNTALSAQLPRVRETMREEIARALKSLPQGEASRLPFFARAIGVRQATTTTTRGDAATVALNAGERPVELSMRRDGERWKVVTVKDPQLASEIATRLAASIPAGPPAQQQQQQNPPRRRGR
ncbi:MAG TPA: hypothetical protein VF508_02365, partial [Pyrinomonadaceae bacterium]